jgi:hypothetical protein
VKFLIDRCAGKRSADWLRQQGHDASESRERARRTSGRQDERTRLSHRQKVGSRETEGFGERERVRRRPADTYDERIDNLTRQRGEALIRDRLLTQEAKRSRRDRAGAHRTANDGAVLTRDRQGRAPVCQTRTVKPVPAVPGRRRSARRAPADGSATNFDIINVPGRDHRGMAGSSGPQDPYPRRAAKAR